MFDHATIRVSDRVASRRFYETVLGEPGYAGDELDELHRVTTCAGCRRLDACMLDPDGNNVAAVNHNR